MKDWLGLLLKVGGALLGALLLPVLGLIATELAKQWGWTNDTTIAAVAKAIETALAWVFSWYLYAVIGVAGLALGVYLGVRLMTKDEDQREKVVRLGHSMASLLGRHDNRHPLAGAIDQDADDQHFLPRAKAINMQLRAMGMKFPSVPEQVTAVSEKAYLTTFYREIAPTFRSGEVAAARELAASTAKKVEADVRRV
jgi:hypothetical protein